MPGLACNLWPTFYLHRAKLLLENPPGKGVDAERRERVWGEVAVGGGDAGGRGPRDAAVVQAELAARPLPLK